MNFTIKELLRQTDGPFRKDYWKIAAASFLLVVLSFGLSYSSIISSVNQIPDLVRSIMDNEFTASRNWDMRMAAVLLTMVGGLLIFSTLIKFLLDVFLANPIEVGANRMMLDAMEEEGSAMLARLAYAFDADYINTVKVAFLQSLFTNLWTILLIVPGIYKYYEYKMIPYLLAENPYLPQGEAFKKSKELMKGYKWKAFLLDLYFIPWEILGLLTFGVVTIFYVEPKRQLAKTALYLKIKELNQQGGE
ncbi:MAG: DUF975 family protein [Lachnospiraceae bacterium]|nr:DUF975 family protein [Lachnospiraceae bacterium]